MSFEENTICAIATASGGAIGIVRVSGKDALFNTDAIFRAINGKSLVDAKPNTIHYGEIINQHGEIIDDVLVAVYHAPFSYTGEDAVEIMCHGSLYILQMVVQLLCLQGCVLAQPGEYTQRAFLNGKMDLSQAEAVADLIASSNVATHRLAISQMRGGYSQELRTLREQLLEMTALLELEIDFSEEDVEFANRQQLFYLAQKVDKKISNLVESFRLGNVLKNGIPVAIIGQPNVGKSTLLNRLLHEDKALVSEVRGTTRDAIEDSIFIQGILFRFIDTAGIHTTDDVVESMGIERTLKKAQEADVIIMMKEPGVEYPNISVSQNQYVIRIENKTEEFQALTGIGVDKLEENLVKYAQSRQQTDSDIIVTNVRHIEALRLALSDIQRVEQELTDGYTTSDIIVIDLHGCINHLAEITGDITSDETLHSIFSRFCIGK
ncbi:MAG: tRNA uridine-5-carboxymethylaminomethyl(34) synthesis GTPase MnmE [Bacteroidaceae bacterium]|nr:tRNA uridine-5-carboxymethylaminomethyl(34) synthesis GTPase MnmE [Bacteroidaceae bacterium]